MINRNGGNMKQVFIIFSICLGLFYFCYAETSDSINAGADSAVFPSFSAKNLNDSMITVPDPVSPKVEVAVMTFSRQEIAATDSWINTFNSIYRGNSSVCYSQTAVIGDIPLIGGLIINGMKGNISKDKWDRFLTYTGDREKIIKSLAVDNPALFYVYVIGKDGLIKWMVKSSKSTDADITALLKAVKKETSAGNRK
jgi:hypothetical protein